MIVAMALLENFTLGVGGVVDLLSRADDKVLDVLGVDEDSSLRTIANANNTSFAASIYAEQVEADPSLSESKLLSSVEDPKERRELAYSAGVAATEAGGLERALSETVDQVAEKIGAEASFLKRALVVAGVALGLGGGAYLAWRLTR